MRAVLPLLLLLLACAGAARGVIIERTVVASTSTSDLTVNLSIGKETAECPDFVPLFRIENFEAAFSCGFCSHCRLCSAPAWRGSRASLCV